MAIVIKAEPVMGAGAYPLYDTTLLSYRALAGGGTVRRTIHLLYRSTTVVNSKIACKVREPYVILVSPFFLIR